MHDVFCYKNFVSEKRRSRQELIPLY